MTKKNIYYILLALGLSIFVCAGGQAIVVEDSFMVTDVTPVQFCVVWTTSEPATGWVKVFEDPEGAAPNPDAVVEFMSTAHPPAEDIGVMKVKVTGLKPDTEYFFKTETIAKDPADATLYRYPADATFIMVKTEKGSIPVRNDVIAMKVVVGEDKAASGMLVAASIVDRASNPISSHPVTGWVGDGVEDQYVLIDTNNFFYNGTNLDVERMMKDEEFLSINLKLIGGSKGFVDTQDTLPDPAENSGIQALAAVARLPGSGSEPSAPAAEANSGGGGGGASCFISTAAFGSAAEDGLFRLWSLWSLLGLLSLLALLIRCALTK